MATVASPPLASLAVTVKVEVPSIYPFALFPSNEIVKDSVVEVAEHANVTCPASLPNCSAKELVVVVISGEVFEVVSLMVTCSSGGYLPTSKVIGKEEPPFTHSTEETKLMVTGVVSRSASRRGTSM